MANEKFTELPSVVSATAADIIAAVQAGVSVQLTLQQILDLTSSDLVKNYAGNPNGHVAGDTFNFCWDSSNHNLWVCITSGNASTAAWVKSISLVAGSGITLSQSGATIIISTSGSGLGWTEVTATSATMSVNTGYIANNAALVTLTLPSTAAIGDVIYIIGKGAGGWLIAQGASQLIHIGSSASTSGAGGSVASTNRYDSCQLVCTVADTTWTTLGGVQGVLTIV